MTPRLQGMYFSHSDVLLPCSGVSKRSCSLCRSKYMVDASKAEYMSGEDSVVITVSIGGGSGSGTAWGCDLSYDYVKINAEYTT
mmetsp:Transcript_41380/g.163002  ORF Transcript_41380/g.163002 Transcript_41380/m.163002 type:complete len:84 (-) Transcript_41380:45-296(-)